MRARRPRLPRHPARRLCDDDGDDDGDATLQDTRPQPRKILCNEWNDLLDREKAQLRWTVEAIRKVRAARREARQAHESEKTRDEKEEELAPPAFPHMKFRIYTTILKALNVAIAAVDKDCNDRK